MPCYRRESAPPRPPTDGCIAQQPGRVVESPGESHHKFLGSVDESFYFVPDRSLQNPLLAIQGKFAEAEPLYERSQVIREKVLGPEHPDVAQSLNNRAGLLSNVHSQ